MAVDVKALTVRHYPDPVLRRRAEPLSEVTEQVRAVAQRMIELMHAHRGAGLAGPQVGLPWRLFVANPTAEPGADQVFINPVLSSPSHETELHDEGCLSLPHIEGQVNRPAGITIDALDAQGHAFQMTDQGLPARVWQHEVDHLDGILIIDKMPPLDRTANRRALKDLEKAGAR
jgi:peptide deformylase